MRAMVRSVSETLSIRTTAEILVLTHAEQHALKTVSNAMKTGPAGKGDS